MSRHATIDHGLFGASTSLQTAGGPVTYFRLQTLADRGHMNFARLPMTIKILLESVLRNRGTGVISEQDILHLAGWTPDAHARLNQEFPFYPARVVMQDFTGVPAAVDLAAMRAAVSRLGGDPRRVNPLVPVDLVIDHSVQVDFFGSEDAVTLNVEREYQRSQERYTLLRWSQQAFENFRVVPPGHGIVHQINLEYLASVVHRQRADGSVVAYPDSLVGTDSHTTMINGLGVLGWGVGGIEAEAVLLGQPLYLLTPEVIGVRFRGQLPEGTTGTDLVLTVTQILRKRGVVGAFVEFTGAGLSQLSLADRATIANMCPEYGATAALFPVDAETLRYLRLTGRDPKIVDLVERYTKEQGLFREDTDQSPDFSDTLELDLGTVEPSLAGPRRPQDRVRLAEVGDSIRAAYPSEFASSPHRNGSVTHGSVAIAAITSCTNTSNPIVMLGAGLLAKKAVEKGLSVSPTVKTSLAPGSRVVADYLVRAGLMRYLEALQFHVVGYGCATCIGNSGPLAEPVARAIQDNGLVVAAVLSSNRNFEGRIHPQVRASYLASPPLVLAFALAGTVDIDLVHDPLGTDRNGSPVYLRDIWPTSVEIGQAMATAVGPDLFRAQYVEVFEGDDHWRALPVPEESNLFEWDPASTYVREPPFFDGLTREPAPIDDIVGARVLVMLGHSITTDHISPAGSLPKAGPAGQYLVQHGVQPRDFNSYGARRGNHEVLLRGTFGNVRLRNELAPDREGDWTVHLPDGAQTRIYEAAVHYQRESVPLLVIAGKEYGSGSSRDWAAKGTMLLGARAVIAESYERIHRSNLVGMGVLPLQFRPGETRRSLGLTGRELFDVRGIASGLRPGQELTVRATREDGSQHSFGVTVRIDMPIEIDYYQHGGILPYVLRALITDTQGRTS